MMRNLLGRLNARSEEELARIARAWRIPVTAPDRSGQIGQLYRSLTDPRTARDLWGMLDEGEQAIVRLLVLGDESALPLAAIAERLGMDEADARQAAARLYHKGILAREGDDDPLPVGVAPRLFLPRELLLLFRRVQDEIEAGDLSTTPLRALLSLLDDAEIEEAGQIWGLKVIPGLRERDELSRRLLEQVGDVARMQRVATARRRDALRIWQRVRGEPGGVPVALPEAARAAGLDGTLPAHAHRLREALAELERALLVWHTYRPDGTRWLFIPAEIRAPAPPARDDLPPLTPLAVVVEEPSAWRHPHALAWDLLTLLREMARPHAPALHRDEEFPRPWLRAINRRLWIAGKDVPPEGYAGFLLALAEAAGLVEGGGEDDPLRVTAAVRSWRDRSFPEQTAALHQSWLDQPAWVEGERLEDLHIWGADWRGFRRKTLRALSGLEVATWYPLEDAAAWVAALDPELLGRTFTAASARHHGAASEGERRREAIAEAVAETLVTAFSWFGLVQVAPIPRQGRAVRLTGAGARAAAGDPPGPGERAAGRLEVRPDLTIDLHDPTPLQVWSVSAFADLARLGETSQYRLTDASVAAALEAGFDLRQITGFLEQQSKAPLPDAVREAIGGWASAYRRVRMRRALLFLPDDVAAIPTIRAIAEAAGLTVHPIEGGVAVEVGGGEGGEGEERRLAQALRDHGFNPHALAGQRGGSRRS